MVSVVQAKCELTIFENKSKDIRLPRLSNDSLLNRKKLASRSNMQILCDILDSLATGETSVTRIMFRTNTCWSSLQVYFQLLRKAEVIYEEDGSDFRKSYHLTAKGFSILGLYREMKELI
jgi:predicted transcriptional regulator